MPDSAGKPDCDVALAVVDHLADGIVLADVNGTVIYANATARRMLEVPGQSLEGAPLPGPLDPGLSEVSILGALGTAEMSVSTVVSDGKTFYAAALRDVSERKRLEEAMRVRNASLESELTAGAAALETSQAELESFLYTVSHDLRAPLRAMNGLAMILQEDYAGQIDEDAGDLLNRIAEAGNRMREMLDGLLTLSRVGRHAMNPAMLDLSALAREVADTFAPEIPGHCPDVAIAPGLEVYADRKLVRMLLENLIGNAWKFTHGSHDPRITVRSGPENSFCIEDNGVGFDGGDEAYAPFQRFHGNEYRGSGLGLSAARKIVERHGGHIWHTSRPGKGARFCFTLQATGT